uniref:Uncharacterized protein n=1 Tax=Oryza meridionalis TaxID=40149 RepID=A0A0E0CXG6_9ORYZ
MATAAPAADKRIRQPASNVPIMAQSFAPTRAKLGASNTVSVALCRTMDNDDGLIPSGRQTVRLDSTVSGLIANVSYPGAVVPLPFLQVTQALKVSRNDASNQYCRSSASGKCKKVAAGPTTDA